MKQAEGGREMEGEVVFRRDTKSNLMKAVSGTEWMYRRGALERGRQVSDFCCVHCLCQRIHLRPNQYSMLQYVGVRGESLG